MKILHLLPSLDPAQGGTVSCVREIVAAQRAAGDDPEILTLDAGEAHDSGTLDGIPHHRLPARPSTYRYSPALVPWLKESHAAYDAFVIHGLWQYHGFGAWRILRRAGRPYLVFPHGMLDPWFKRAHPLKHLKKWLYWPWAEYRVLRDAARVVFTTEEERRAARGSFALYRAREAVVPLGISEPLPTVDPRALLSSLFPATTGKRLFLFLGRLHEKKGCDLLLAAFAAVHGRDSDAVLLMAGPDGGAEAALRAQAEALGLGHRVVWSGMLRGEAKQAVLAAAEIFLLPSHQENFGVAVVEALAAGTPVLVSDRVNLWREIEEDGAGLVCRDDRDDLSRSLREWEALGAPARQEMRERARASFDRRYRIGHTVEKLGGILHSAISS